MTATVLLGLLVWLLGLCIGSFLNVVIYRLPLGLSIASPAWSFCPHCRTPIRWFDNLPVLSWVLLRGRCRSCRAPISVQYPIVEAVTGLAFALVWTLLFVEGARAGLPIALQSAWPAGVAWLALAAVLIACSAMDITAYLIDTRLTDAAVIVGVLAYAALPFPAFVTPRAAEPLGAGAVAAFVISVGMLWLALRRADPDGGAGPAIEDRAAETPDRAADESPTTESAVPPRGLAALGVLAVVATVGLTLLLLIPLSAGSAALASVAGWVVPATLLLCFVIIAASASHPRAADQQIHAEVEREGPRARRLAGRELLWLTPIALAAALAFAAVAWLPAGASSWRGIVEWRVGPCTPLGGAVFAMHGAMVGAAAGWAVRLIFTVIFGREALGTGDIFILAAAGACAGWDIALLGFLLSIGIALAGWLVSLLSKRGLMIPLGPWLALGFAAALWLNRPAETLAEALAGNLCEAWRERPSALLMLAGVLLVGSAAAVLLARMVRRLVEPPAHSNE